MRGRFGHAWSPLALAILGGFAVQETFEGPLSCGAGAGVLAASIVSGGWLALPLSLAISGVLALAHDRGPRGGSLPAARAAQPPFAPVGPSLVQLRLSSARRVRACSLWTRAAAPRRHPPDRPPTAAPVRLLEHRRDPMSNRARAGVTALAVVTSSGD
ncbi:MAG: hypothetical protein WKF40_07325 [Thermoleophilaceae bacterium]